MREIYLEYATVGIFIYKCGIFICNVHLSCSASPINKQTQRPSKLYVCFLVKLSLQQLIGQWDIVGHRDIGNRSRSSCTFKGSRTVSTGSSYSSGGSICSSCNFSIVAVVQVVVKAAVVAMVVVVVPTD